MQSGELMQSKKAYLISKQPEEGARPEVDIVILDNNMTDVEATTSGKIQRIKVLPWKVIQTVNTESVDNTWFLVETKPGEDPKTEILLINASGVGAAEYITKQNTAGSILGIDTLELFVQDNQSQ